MPHPQMLDTYTNSGTLVALFSSELEAYEYVVCSLKEGGSSDMDPHVQNVSISIGGETIPLFAIIFNRKDTP
jgi:hypothetical protein